MSRSVESATAPSGGCSSCGHYCNGRLHNGVFHSMRGPRPGWLPAVTPGAGWGMQLSRMSQLSSSRHRFPLERIQHVQRVLKEDSKDFGVVDIARIVSPVKMEGMLGVTGCHARLPGLCLDPCTVRVLIEGRNGVVYAPGSFTAWRNSWVKLVDDDRTQRGPMDMQLEGMNDANRTHTPVWGMRMDAKNEGCAVLVW